MKNINELIFRVNDNLRNNLDVDKNDIKKLLNIAMEMEKQLAISRVVGQSEQLFCNNERMGVRCVKQCLGCFQFQNKD